MSKQRASKAEALRSVQEIREFHELGRRALQLLPGMSIAEQAEELGCTAAKLAVARRFATPGRGYSDDQLDELCDQILEYRPLLGTSHVEILIAVPWPRRRKLQRRCVRRNWSRRQLVEAKVKIRKPKSGGGRYPDVTPGNAAVELKQQAHRFCRLVGQMKKLVNGKPSIFDRLPLETRLSVEAAVLPMRQVRRAAQAQLRKTQQPD